MAASLSFSAGGLSSLLGVAFCWLRCSKKEKEAEPVVTVQTATVEQHSIQQVIRAMPFCFPRIRQPSRPRSSRRSRRSMSIAAARCIEGNCWRCWRIAIWRRPRPTTRAPTNRRKRPTGLKRLQPSRGVAEGGVRPEGSQGGLRRPAKDLRQPQSSLRAGRFTAQGLRSVAGRA